LIAELHVSNPTITYPHITAISERVHQTKYIEKKNQEIEGEKERDERRNQI
jgi:hypothetical protein